MDNHEVMTLVILILVVIDLLSHGLPWRRP
jgi:hypothetical protein